MASSPPTLTPQQVADLQSAAALMRQRVQTGINVPGGLMIGQPGQLSAAGSGISGSLYDYAQDAPILSLEGNKEYESLDFQPLPGTNYRLTVGGKVIGSASTPQEVAALVAQANEISKGGGASVDVRLQQEVRTATPDGGPATGFTDVYANRENNTGQLGTLLPMALAAISGGTLAPFLGGGAIGTGLGAGIGSVAGSLGTGSNLENALIKGAITGVTAGALSGLGAAAPAGSGGGGTTLSFAGAPFAVPSTAIHSFAAPSLSGLGSALSSTAPFALLPGETLINVAAPKIASGLASGLAGLGGSAVSGVFDQFLSDNAGMIGDSAPEAAPDEEPFALQPGETMINVVTPKAASGLASGLGLAAIPAIGAAAAALGTGPSITPAMQDAAMNAGVESPRIDTQFPNSPETAGLGTTATGGAGMGVADYLQAGLGGLSTIQGLAGLLGGSGGNTGIGDGLNPNRGLVSYQPLNRQQITPTFDPFTYGQTGGEFRFFSDATPQFQTGIGAERASILPEPQSPTPRFKDGGHARGIGGGQDDLIDARLSDGEYVIDAQTVSDLGDGSNNEGARRLNEMRELIRKRAGRKRVKTIAPPQKSVKSLLGAVK